MQRDRTAVQVEYVKIIRGQAMRERIEFASEQKVSEFINLLRKDLDEGYRVVPLIGAGFSATAGFPLLVDLHERDLPYWIVRALGLNPWATTDSRLHDRRNSVWDPRRGGWPEMASEIALHATSPHRQLSRSGSANPTEVPPGPYSRERAAQVLTLAIESLKAKREAASLRYSVVWEAREALNRDWRAMIEFLSRLQRRNWNGRRKLGLGTVDDSVTDSLFNYFNHRRKPALTHRMLEALAPVWRSHVLITTNFDTLIEQAFHIVGTSLLSFDVPRAIALPDAGLVLAQRSLLKLHGGRFGLRVDESIDRPVDDRDVENFLAYLAGHRLSGESCDDKVAIFVSGLSCRDRRTQSLLWAACERFRNLRIYWLRFTDRLPDFLESQRYDIEIRDLAHPEHGLLLLQLYQAVTNTIPPSGIIFPGLWQLPAPPVIPSPDTEQLQASSPLGELGRTFEEACERLRHCVKTELAGAQRRPIILRMGAGDRGGVTVCANLFTDAAWHSDTQIRGLWLDLDDVAQPVDVCLRLVMMAAKMDGEPDPISTLNLHAFDQDANSERIDSFFSALGLALARTYARSGRRLLVFLNAQEGVGCNSAFASSLGRGDWVDNDAVLRLLRVLCHLNNHDHYGVQFVAVIREEVDKKGANALNMSIDAAVARVDAKEEFGWAFSGGEKDFRAITISNPCSAFDPGEAVRLAIDSWLPLADGKFDRLRAPFLMMLAIFRQARYPAGLVRVLAEYFEEFEGLETMRTDELSSVVAKWIGDLEEKRVLRRKPGGFVWLNSVLRKLLAAEVKLHWDDCVRYEPWEDAFLRIGSLIARWYGRVLLASSDPLAAVEGAHHALGAVGAWVRNSREANVVSLARVSVALEHAALLLRTGRPLFERRLSSQFADQSLDVLQREAEETLMAVLQSSTVLQLQPSLVSYLHKLIHGLVRLRSVVALRESEYDRVVALARNPLLTRGCRKIGTQWQSLARDIRMNAAGALVCQRRYEEADRELQLLWKQIGLSPIDLNEKRFEAARRWISITRAGRAGESGATQLKCFVARLARWRLYLLLNRSQVQYLTARSAGHRSPAGVDPWKARRAALREALWFYDFGIEVLRAVPAVEDRFVFEENVRLRAHAALCRGILELHQGNPKTTRASTLLADGSAYCGEFPLKDADINTAILHLRRAELALLTVGNDQSLKEFRTRLLEWVPENHTSSSVLLDEQTALMDKRDILTTAARVYDALWHLEAAEEQLACHPKNRWWWSIYCVLKLKATEYLYTLRLLRELTEGGEGPREPRLVPPDASRFFFGGIVEIVRAKGMSDAFYLTRIFHSYARTMRAQLAYLWARAAAEPSRDDLQSDRLERAQHTFVSRRLDLVTLVAAARRALTPVDPTFARPDHLVFDYFACCYEDACTVMGFFPIDA